MGTLMPTPRVSVPEMTSSRPLSASCSMRRRYFGSIPAWWTPTPCSSSLRRLVPNPLPKVKPLMAAAIAAFCSLEARSTESRLVARSIAPFWE